MTWKAKQDGTDGQETPEIKSFFMRRKQNLETGENRIYTVRYTLKGVSDSQEETLEIAAGDTVKWNFKEWYVVPKDSCVTDVEITVPADASFYLDAVSYTHLHLVFQRNSVPYGTDPGSVSENSGKGSVFRKLHRS